MDAIVGHSNGWLCAAVGPEFTYTQAVNKLAGATCCELVIDRGPRLDQLVVPELEKPQCLSLTSLHLPNLSDVDALPSDERAELGERLQLITRRFGLGTGSLHPDLASCETAEWLKGLGVPFGIENMDRSKASYRSVEDVSAALRLWKVPLVLDVQHAFENSKDAGGDGIQLSLELTRAAQLALGVTHVHVSGEISSKSGAQLDNHASLLRATNSKIILEAVRAVKRSLDGPVRIILEGNYLPGDRPGAETPLAAPSQRAELLAVAAENMRKEREMVLEAIS